jgi:hypothetical protein
MITTAMGGVTTAMGVPGASSTDCVRSFWNSFWDLESTLSGAKLLQQEYRAAGCAFVAGDTVVVCAFLVVIATLNTRCASC